MRRFALLLAALAACSPEGETPPPGDLRRVASLDVCADQFVLALAPREAIAGISPDADDDFSLMRSEAAGLPVMRPEIEDILLHAPDAVVRSWGGGAGAPAALGRVGIEVVQVPWADDMTAVAAAIRSVGVSLATELQAEDLAARVPAGRAVDADTPRPTALYLTPSGVTTGPGSLVHEMLLAAGFANHETRPGWHPVDLEALVSSRPDHVVTGFFDARQRHAGEWSVGRHPLLIALLDGIPRTDLPGAWLSCQTWALGDAVRLLAEAADAP